MPNQTNAPIPFEMAYFHGLYQLPLRAPAVALRIDRSSVGPCRQLFRNERLPIAGLDPETVYEVAVTVDRLGLELDRHGVCKDDAALVYSDLVVAVDRHTQRYESLESGPLSAGILARHFAESCARRFDGVTDNLTDGVLHDVSRVVNSQSELEAAFQIQLERQETQKQQAYADESIEASCDELLNNVPTFRILSEVFDQCERSSWDVLNFPLNILPAMAFTIAVDGETWLHLKKDPTRKAQTEWLIVDARTPEWCFYERAKTRGIDQPSKAQVVGAMYDIFNKTYRPFESLEIFIPDHSEYKPWALSSRDSSRFLRVAVTFMLLLQGDGVTVYKSAESGHSTVNLPPDKTVDEIISEVLTRSRPRK